MHMDNAASINSKCRLCQSTELKGVIDLGNQSFTGIFPASRDENVPTGNLSLVRCANCGLVQLEHSFPMNLLYGSNYGYRSGLNSSMVRHLGGISKKLQEIVKLHAGDLVIDIGSNDSTLLQNYSKDLKLVGVDPSGEKFKKYYPPHVTLVPDFFPSEKLSAVTKGQKAKIITSIAMFYDLEDPSAFVRTICDNLDDSGVWLLEQSYLPSMLTANSYDTICHEHLEYYGLLQIKRMVDNAGMKILDVELNDVNGGSFAVMVAKKNSPLKSNQGQIDKLLASEVETTSVAAFDQFRQRVEVQRRKLHDFLDEQQRLKKLVLGYGASTKGNVLMQYCGLTTEQIPHIIEVNEDKFGKFTPGTKIPIISEKEGRALKPDYFLVFPWHFKAMIVEKEKAFLAAGGKLVFPLPEFEIVSG